MSFFTYRQNNSGGVFDIDDNVTIVVIVEASCADEANAKFCSIGGYFDGCEAGMDCECCGDRWSEAWDDEGTETPMVYGQSPAEWSAERYSGVSGKNVVVHYADGKVEWF